VNINLNRQRKEKATTSGSEDEEETDEGQTILSGEKDTLCGGGQLEKTIREPTEKDLKLFTRQRSTRRKTKQKEHGNDEKTPGPPTNPSKNCKKRKSP